jgi:hypothetical protein
MAGIIYLDVDDEITSAAARIRAADADRVAVVLPYGSRVATSRINFRLLARDALTHERRLAVVASDAATRALAASAGLPVFASVSEYEGSLVGRDGAEGDGRGDGATGRPGGMAGGGGTGGAASVDPDPREPDAPRGASPADDPELMSGEPDPDAPTGRFPAVGAAAAAGAVAGAASAIGASSGGPGSRGGATERIAVPAPAARPARTSTPAPEPRVAPTGLRDGTSATVSTGAGRNGRPRLVRRPAAIVGLAVLALALLVGGVGAYALLPSATAVVTPREEPIGPLSFGVTADPDASAPDPEQAIVPAERIGIEVASSDTFESTGKRVVERKAKGTVTFQSFDPGGANTIPARSVIATEGRIQFRTTRAITLPAAQIVPEGSGAVIIPTRANVAVEAVRAGEAGNVPSNAITLVPRGENPTLTKVRNADPTEGGSREEFPKVAQADLDAALATLEAALAEEFRTRLEDPSLAPAGMTVFPASAVLGTPTPTVDPATLLDEEMASFDLGLTATGSVIAADPAPVAAIGEERLRANVAAGRELVEGSTRVEVGEGTVVGGQVSFPVTASAAQVGTLDPGQLEALIRGKPLDEARSLLSDFGQVELTVWPEWVTTVPTLDARVDVRTERPIGVTSASPSPTP